ncbi:MAG: RNA polymerase factor sigma-54, partial [Rudaea sp.]
MKPALQLRLHQTLALTPQLQQAIKLLQLSSIELEIELRNVLESNPLLELTETDSQEDAFEADEYDATAEAPSETTEPV